MDKGRAYKTIYHRYMTEKVTVLENLKIQENNRCLSKCKSPKYVFIVNKKATKPQIARAIEVIYAEKKIKVKEVNTINMKPKKRRVRGRLGYRSAFKKAIVTLEEGDMLDEAV